MGTTLKTLADGQLPNTKTTLYTAPSQVEVDSIRVVNEGAGDNLIKLYSKPGATSRIIVDLTLHTKESFSYTRLPMNTGELIEGEATNASEVTYVIKGAEIT